MYAKLLKRAIDFVLALIAVIVLSPFLLIFTVAGAIMMRGNPFFTQLRPGKKDKHGKEKIFKLIKFRTMSNKIGENGEFLPDEQRLNRYGKFLRSTSIDELPSLVNILLGQLSIVGPRPQLVRDLVFMTEEQRHRHDVRPGLTGLAQISGRNNISWERKFEYDLLYICRGITFVGDLKIILQTIGKVVKRSNTVREGTVSDMDYGDWMMAKGKVSKEEYDEKQAEARSLLGIAAYKESFYVNNNTGEL